MMAEFFDILWSARWPVGIGLGVGGVLCLVFYAFMRLLRRSNDAKP